MNSTDELLDRLDNYIDFAEAMEKNSKKTVKETVQDILNYQKHFLCTAQLENKMREIYEQEGEDSEFDRLVIDYIKNLNALSQRENRAFNDMIILSCKSLAIASVFTNDEEEQVKLIKTAKNLQNFLV